MRHTLRIVALLVLIALGGGAYWYFVKQGGTINTLLAGKVPSPGGASAGGPAAGGPPGGAPPMPVEASPVKTGTVSRTVTAVGSLLSSESVVIRPEVAGKVS